MANLHRVPQAHVDAAVRVASGVMVALAVVGLVTNVFLAGTNGQPALGTMRT